MIKNYMQMFDFGSKTDKGRVRDKNEDNLGFFNTTNGQVALICDGMGGHSAGMLASEIAVNSIREYFESNIYDDIEKAIEDAFKYANNQVFDEASDNAELLGMGTTCAFILVKDNFIYHAHVGDSRIYMLRDGALKQLTKDHTYVQQLLDKGELSKEEVTNHPRKNELLRAIGVSNDIEVELIPNPIEAKNGDVFLICSDGLTSMVNEITIEYSLNQDISSQEKANRLTELAINEGGYDNISVQVLQFDSIPEESKEGTSISPVKSKFSGLLQKYIPFFRKYPKAIFAVYALIALIFTWAIYDMFFKSAKTPLYQENIETVVQNSDSTNSNQIDTTIQESNAAIDHEPEASNTSDAVYLTYTIKKGDALSLISQQFNVRINKLMEINKLSNAGIRIGQQIKIPLKAIHTVKTGDNLYEIAKKYGVTRKLLRKANRLKNDSDIYVGNNVYVPFP